MSPSCGKQLSSRYLDTSIAKTRISNTFLPCPLPDLIDTLIVRLYIPPIAAAAFAAVCRFGPG